MRTTTAFLTGQRRLVLALLALALAVGSLGMTGGFGPGWTTAEVSAQTSGNGGVATDDS
jgi:hypothetical protein